MKTRLKLFLWLFMPLFIVSFSSCDDNNHEPSIETTSWSVEAGSTFEVLLKEGHDNYSFTFDNPNLATATYTPLSKTEGILAITGKKGGKTILTIEDIPTGDKLIVDLEVIVYDFVIDKSEIKTYMREETETFIRSGNKQYEIKVKDASIANASLSQTAILEDGKQYHIIGITGVKPGNTEIYITDLILEETKTIKVSVSYPHLSLVVEKITTEVLASNSEEKTAIENDILKNALLQSGRVYSMVRTNDLPLPLYIFKNSEDWKKGNYSSKGGFSFMIGANIGLYYSINDTDQPLYIEGSKSSFTTIFNLFDIYFIDHANNKIEDNKIRLTEDLTEKYKQLYPTSTDVKIQAELKLYAPDTSEIPLKLVQ